MSSVTPLLDTLLATRLAQRLDLVPLKAQVDLADPGFANQVELVTNDVRLNSREGLQQQLGVATNGGSANNLGAGARSGQGENVTLSAVARALTAILDPPGDATPRIFGSAALWSDSEPPDTQKLAAGLARTVAGSGLFYESHLQQYAAGTRTLAQMAQEPQAQLNTLAGQPNSSVVQVDRNSSVQGSASSVNMTVSDPSVATIHPAAAALVRQQLELLAQPQFRWSGEAWPGAAMEWDIAEDEKDKNRGEADTDTPASRWSTRIAMELPRLGNVEARLSISGSTLQLRLGASQQATVSLLNVAGNELPARLDAQGLQLTGLKVAWLAAAPSANP